MGLEIKIILKKFFLIFGEFSQIKLSILVVFLVYTVCCVNYLNAFFCTYRGTPGPNCANIFFCIIQLLLIFALLKLLRH